MRFIALFLTFGFLSFPAMAQEHEPMTAAQHAHEISLACPGNWDQGFCLKLVSESAFDMVVNYANALDRAGKGDMLETLKQECAAATVSSEEDIPAYAYKSAYTVCSNAIYDISEQTRVKPDQSHYQLLVGAVLCMSKDSRCPALESQMKNMR